jgi:hypothetical protein
VDQKLVAQIRMSVDHADQATDSGAMAAVVVLEVLCAHDRVATAGIEQ